MNASTFRTRTAVLASALLLAVTLTAKAGGKGKHATETQTFTVAAGANITVEGNKSASLADIKPGDHVRIAYTQADNILTANHIRDAGPHPVHPAKMATHKTGVTQHASTGLHAHGVVETIDNSAQTLTINENTATHTKP